MLKTLPILQIGGNIWQKMLNTTTQQSCGVTFSLKDANTREIL
jgi:hypothetical protein